MDVDDVEQMGNSEGPKGGRRGVKMQTVIFLKAEETRMAFHSGERTGGLGHNNPGGQANKVTTRRWQWQGTCSVLPEEDTVIPDPVCVCCSASGLVPVTAVGGPGRNPVDANVGLHTQNRLVLQLGRHLGSALRATGGGAYGMGADCWGRGRWAVRNFRLRYFRAILLGFLR